MTDNEKTSSVPIDDDALDKVAGGVMHFVVPKRENHAANAAPNGPMNISSRDPVPAEISTVPIDTQINDLIKGFNDRDHGNF